MLLRADAQQEYDLAMGRFPLQERAGVLRTPALVYLISYFAAGNSLRSDTPCRAPLTGYQHPRKPAFLESTSCDILLVIRFCAEWGVHLLTREKGVPHA